MSVIPIFHGFPKPFPPSLSLSLPPIYMILMHVWVFSE
jgi:hypothetical protein